jgi:hypothetical protein
MKTKIKEMKGQEATFSLLFVRCYVTSMKEPNLCYVGNLIIVKRPTWQLMFTRRHVVSRDGNVSLVLKCVPHLPHH